MVLLFVVGNLIWLAERRRNWNISLALISKGLATACGLRW